MQNPLISPTLEAWDVSPHVFWVWFCLRVAQMVAWGPAVASGMALPGLGRHFGGFHYVTLVVLILIGGWQ